MTVAARPASVSYQEDGQTVSFPAPFRFKSARALVVERIGADGTIIALQLGVDYSVTGGATDAGGTVVRTAATAGATLRIRRWTERAQAMTYTTGDRFPATSHEEALDQQMLVSQEQDATIEETRGRALMLPPGEIAPDLMPLAQRVLGKKKVIGVNRNTGAFEVEDIDDAYVGATGPSNNTRLTLADMRAAAIGDKTSLFDGDLWTWTAGDFSAAPSAAIDRMIVASNQAPLSAGAWIRNVAIANVKHFGAKGNGLADDTAAIQAAANTGARLILFPDGEYLHRDLVFSTAYQRFYGPGARLTRISATATVLLAGRGIHLVEMRVGCQTSGMAGNNITVTAPDVRLIYCESRDCSGIPILALNCGGGLLIEGGVYQTTDQSANGWDGVIRHNAPGTNTLYCFISKVLTNQHTGGFLFDGDVGSSAIDKSEFGKMGMLGGGAAKVSNCRVGGKSVVESGFASFSQTDFNDDIVIGRDGLSNIGSIRFAPTCTLKAGKTLTISNNVVESSFHLGQVKSAGAQIVVRSHNNDLWYQEMDAPVGIGAQSGAPTFGDGTLTTRMSSEGRRTFLHLSFQLGAQSSMGGGNFFNFIAPFKARSSSSAIAQVTEGGVGHWSLVARMLAGSDQILFFPTSAPDKPVGNAASATNPFPWKSGDQITFKIDFERVF